MEKLPDLTIKEIIQNQPELLTVDYFLEDVLRKTSFLDFILHLITNPLLYDNLRQNQQFWKNYAQQQFLPLPSPPPENWFDYVNSQLVDGEILFSQLSNLDDGPEIFLQELRNLKSSPQGLGIPGINIDKDILRIYSVADLNSYDSYDSQENLNMIFSIIWMKNGDVMEMRARRNKNTFSLEFYLSPTNLHFIDFKKVGGKRKEFVGVTKDNRFIYYNLNNNPIYLDLQKILRLERSSLQHSWILL